MTMGGKKGLVDEMSASLFYIIYIYYTRDGDVWVNEYPTNW